MWAAALFSQTGTEICDLIDQTGFRPGVIITNVKDKCKINPRIYTYNIPIYILPWRPTVDQYLKSLLTAGPEDIITLHGWLKIIPPEVCNAFEGRILNGHPGALATYGTVLRGQDPQEIAYKLKLPTAGSIVHVVVPEVDAGEILCEELINIENASLDDVYLKLRITSLNTWTKVLKERLSNA